MGVPGLFYLLILRFLINFDFDDRIKLHNLIFLGLVRVRTPGREEVISFIRTNKGVRSLFIDKMLEDLIKMGLVNEDLTVTDKGREAYFNHASFLKYQPLVRYCVDIMLEHYHDLEGINRQVNLFLPVRKKKQGEKISLAEIWGVK